MLLNLNTDEVVKKVEIGQSFNLPKPKKRLTFYYDANGGTVDPRKKIILSITFKGWNTKVDGTGTNYDANSYIRINGNTTLYAQWALAAIGELPTPTREGYTFVGWYTEADGGTRVYPETKFESTVYAHWKQNAPTSYTLSFNANGGSGAPASVSGNGNVKIPNTVPTRSGYTFKGWATSSSSSTAQYQPGNTYNLSSNVTLYAVWNKVPASYTIKDMNASGKAKYNQKVTVRVKLAGLPSGCTVKVNDKVVSVVDEEVSFYFGRLKKDTSFKVSVFNGNSELSSKTLSFKVDHGFFAKIGGFFLKLFKGDAYATTIRFE